MTVQAGDKEYLRNTLVEPMPTATTAGVTGAGAHAAPGASRARKLGEKVLAWQASQGCQRIPDPKSLDEHEKSLGKSFEDVLRRRDKAIGTYPSRQQLSADEILFINGIPGVPPHGCSVNAASAGAIKADVLIDAHVAQPDDPGDALAAPGILHQPVNQWPTALHSQEQQEPVQVSQEQQEPVQVSVKRRRLQADMQDGASPAWAPCEVSVTAADPNAELARQRLKRLRNVRKEPLKWLTWARVLSWDAMFEAVGKWVRTHQGEGEVVNVRYPSQKSKDKDEKKMANWVYNQRQYFHGKRGRVMNGSRREMLESLPGWTWGSRRLRRSCM